MEAGHPVCHGAVPRGIPGERLFRGRLLQIPHDQLQGRFGDDRFLVLSLSPATDEERSDGTDLPDTGFLDQYGSAVLLYRFLFLHVRRLYPAIHQCDHRQGDLVCHQWHVECHPLRLFSHRFHLSGFMEKEIIPIVLVGSCITLLLAVFLVSFVYLYQRRQFAFLREKQQIRGQFQEELLKTRLEIQEETFRSISEEIHDNIGQTLSFIKLNLNTMTPSLPDRQEEKWRESKDLLTRVIQDLRGLSRTLNTDFIRDIGLVSAVRQQLGMLERSGLYKIQLELLGEEKALPANRELVVYRVIQELLNNIVKHAEATAIHLRMRYESELLAVVVEDDGVGFDPEHLAVQERSGIGLRNVLNRISMING